MKRHQQAAFTLVELLVVIAIIGILASMLLPTIQAARETARRTQCTNQLREVALAIHNYEMANEHFPAGTTNPEGPVRNLPEGEHISWIARLLPFLEEQNKFSHLDLSLSAYHHENDDVRRMTIRTFVCPSDGATMKAMSSYAGCHHDSEAPIDADNNGVFFLNSQVTRDQLTDGAAYTLFVGEKITFPKIELGWLSGTPGTLRNAGSPLNLDLQQRLDATNPAPWLVEAGGDEEPNDEGFLPRSLLGGNPDQPLEVGSFGSYHPLGANFALGDGSVQFFSDQIDQQLLTQMAHRQDGELLDDSTL